MSEIAKRARAAMKAKATKLADRPVEKVDSSDWTPPPLLKADVKTGMRPVSRRAFKKGGKVTGKVEGQAAKVRADRKQRKAGGATEQPIVDRYINRDLKKANEYRDGEKHVGGFKKGGRTKKADGGSSMGHMTNRETGKEITPDEAWGRNKPSRQYKYKSIDDLISKTIPTQSSKRDDLPQQYKSGMKKGGRAGKMDGGAMDPRLGLVKNKAFEFGNNVVTPGLKKGGKVSHPDVAADKALIKKMVKEKALKDGKCYGGRAKKAGGGKSDDDTLSLLGASSIGGLIPMLASKMKSGGRTKKYSGGGVFSGEGYPGKVPGATGGRKARATGGRSGYDKGGEIEHPWETGRAYYDLLTGWHNLDKATPDEIAHMRPEDAEAARAAQKSASGSSVSKSAPKAKQGSSGGRGRGRPSSPERNYVDRPAFTGDHMYYHDRPAYTGDHNAPYERSELPDTSSRLLTRSPKYLSPPNQFPRVGGPNTPPLLGGPNAPPQIGGGSPASPPPAEPLGGPKSNLPAVSEGYQLPSVNEVGKNAVKGALLRYGSKLIPGLGTAMEVLRSTPANAGEIDYMKRNAEMMRDDGHGSGGYKRGGRTKHKGKSNIHITINAGRHGQDQDQMGQGMPMPPMPPAPPAGMPPVPPMPPMGAGGPPMGGGMPPMPPAGGMNTGGRVGKAFGGSFGGGKGGMGGGQPMGGGRVMGGGSYGGQIGANPALGGGGMGRGVALGQLPLGGSQGVTPSPTTLTSNRMSAPAMPPVRQDFAAPPDFSMLQRGPGPDPFVGPGYGPLNPELPIRRDFAAPPANPMLGVGASPDPFNPYGGLGGGPMNPIDPVLGGGQVGLFRDYAAPRKSGGRVTKVAKSFKDMEAGAGSGEGRLQKTDIAKARAYRKAGGKVYSSYKDMDAGAGSGFGRLEKSEIQSRKK